jgi:hypothetical protein
LLVATKLLVLAGATSVLAGRTPAPAPALAPAQPMRFSHRVHVAESRIGCTACHPWADRSPVAGLPSLARCQGCHRFVKQDPENPRMTEEMRPLVAKLRESPATPIAWARVHRLPDHVHFGHAPHVRAGLACRECHGDVERMDEARRVAPLDMAWCLGCHQRKRSERPAELARLTDCVTCHR